MTAQSSQDVHILVLIHGMWGSPSNLASMKRIMNQIRINDSSSEPGGPALHVMIPETNQAESTYDGIDWGGERVAAEVSTRSLYSFHSWPGFISKQPRTGFQRNREIRERGQEGDPLLRHRVFLGRTVCTLSCWVRLLTFLPVSLELTLPSKQHTPSAQVLRRRHASQL
jgi:hypothetical protein